MRTLSKLIPQSPRRANKRTRSLSRNSRKSNNNEYLPPPRTPTTQVALVNTTPTRNETLFKITAEVNGKKLRKTQEKYHRKNVIRYRGFSTSISSLFLDEQVVCGAVSWCGLLASSRTEHLLKVREAQLRKRNRGGHQSLDDATSPSKVLGLLLITSIAFISLTYLIWGFGEVDNTYSSDGTVQYTYYGRALNYEGNNESDTDQRQYYELASKHYVPGVMRICDYNRRFWKPIHDLVWSMVDTSTLTTQTEEDITTSEIHSSFESNNNQNIGEVTTTRSLYNWMDDQGLASDLRFFACLTFFLVLGLFGRRRRMKTRYAIIQARAQDDRLHLGSSQRSQGGNHDDMKREGKYAGACSHTLCGCYPVDRKVMKAGMEYEDGDNDEIAPGFKKKHEDCMNSAFGWYMSCCCGKICDLWCQCFSIGALAQEAREVRLLIPPTLQRVDFITHQPWSDYFGNIYRMRLNWKEKQHGVRRGWKSHLDALSLLSRSIVVTFVVATIVIILTEQFNPRAIFSWADACVLLLTFVQSFVVLGELLFRLISYAIINFATKAN